MARFMGFHECFLDDSSKMQRGIFLMPQSGAVSDPRTLINTTLTPRPVSDPYVYTDRNPKHQAPSRSQIVSNSSTRKRSGGTYSSRAWRRSQV